MLREDPYRERRRAVEDASGLIAYYPQWRRLRSPLAQTHLPAPNATVNHVIWIACLLFWVFNRLLIPWGMMYGFDGVPWIKGLEHRVFPYSISSAQVDELLDGHAIDVNVDAELVIDPERVTVTVLDVVGDGHYRWNGERTNRRIGELLSEFEPGPAIALFIRACPDATYQDVISAMDEIYQLDRRLLVLRLELILARPMETTCRSEANALADD